MNTHALMTTVEAAKWLGLGVSTLEQSRVSGINCPLYLKLGRSVRYRLADLEGFVETRQRASTGGPTCPATTPAREGA